MCEVALERCVTCVRIVRGLITRAVSLDNLYLTAIHQVFILRAVINLMYG